MSIQQRAVHIFAANRTSLRSSSDVAGNGSLVMNAIARLPDMMRKSGREKNSMNSRFYAAAAVICLRFANIWSAVPFVRTASDHLIRAAHTIVTSILRWIVSRPV
jgi:hypothetical protein